MDYESKIIVIEQALALVKSGDVIVTGLGASEAGVFMSQLHTVAARGVRDVMVTNCLPTHESKIYEEQYADIFRVDGWFYAPVLRKYGIYTKSFAPCCQKKTGSYSPEYLHRGCDNAG